MSALRLTKTRREASMVELEAPERANRKDNQKVDNQKGEESIVVAPKNPAMG